MSAPTDPMSFDDTAPGIAAWRGARPASPIARVDTSGRSVVGGRRSNEDQFLVARVRAAGAVVCSGFETEPPSGGWSQEAHLLLVADGLGGRSSGEIASAIAAERVLRRVSESCLGTAWESVLADGFDDADRAIRERARDEAGTKGMATTLTAALICNRRLVVGHAGDSRAYRMRDGRSERLTRDHTAAQRIVDAASEPIAIEDLGRLRHVLVNVVGGESEGVAVDIVDHPVRIGDRILLCSDGLTGAVSEEEIASILDEAGSSSVACEALIQRALDAGARDNVTAVVAIVTGRTTGSAGDPAARADDVQA